MNNGYESYNSPQYYAISITCRVSIWFDWEIVVMRERIGEAAAELGWLKVQWRRLSCKSWVCPISSTKNYRPYEITTGIYQKIGWVYYEQWVDEWYVLLLIRLNNWDKNQNITCYWFYSYRLFDTVAKLGKTPRFI